MSPGEIISPGYPLYGNLHPISDIAKACRVRSTGRCRRAKEEIGCEALLREPTKERAHGGRQAEIFIKRIWEIKLQTHLHTSVVEGLVKLV